MVSDSTLQGTFKELLLVEYLPLPEKNIETLLPFPAEYVCEHGVLSVLQPKGKSFQIHCQSRCENPVTY